jgi:hypothetical protein
MKFSKWLRSSNEAAPFRQAMELNDQMPNEFGLKARCFDVIQAAAETAWEKTKKDLDI